MLGRLKIGAVNVRMSVSDSLCPAVRAAHSALVDYFIFPFLSSLPKTQSNGSDYCSNKIALKNCQKLTNWKRPEIKIYEIQMKSSWMTMKKTKSHPQPFSIFMNDNE